MLKNISLIVLGIALSLSFFSNYRVIKIAKFYQLETEKIGVELDVLEYDIKREKEKFEQNIFSEDRFINNVYLRSYPNDSVLLSQAVGNGKKLVYRFYEESCVQCVEDELKIIKKIGERIGPEKIILIGRYANINHLEAILNRVKILSPYYNYPFEFNLSIDMDPMAIPSFFILDENLITDFVCKSGPEQRLEFPYFDRVMEILK